MIDRRTLHAALVSAIFAFAFMLTVNAEDVRFPDDAGVIDVTKAPYNAVPDGKTDCTDAIQKALDDYAAKNRIIYLPNGTYLVSHTLEWGPSKRLNPKVDAKWAMYNRYRLTILQGQSRDKTIIKLVDNSPEFQDTAWKDKDQRPGGKAVIWTGGWPAQRFRNAVRNLTVNTGTGNPGAIGIQFNASNQGTLHRVRILSGDGQGQIGLDIGYCGDHGPGAGRHIQIEGFDYGIWSGSMNSMTLWNVQIRKQNKAGIRVLSEECYFGDVRSRNTVPALEVGARWGSWAVVINGSFAGGAPDQPAVRVYGKPKDRHVFCRDVTVEGYGKTVEVKEDGNMDVASGNLTEWSLHNGKSLFDGGAVRTLRLPVKEAPEVPYPPPGKDWANVEAFGAKGTEPKGEIVDDTAAFQAALDSGASTIYMPGGKIYYVTELAIPATCERFMGCESYFNGKKITIAEGTKPLVFERFHPWWGKGWKSEVEIEVPRTVIVRDLVGFKVNQRSTGDLFVEDVVGELHLHGKGTRAWCRYLNYEPSKILGVVNDGGDLWMLGGKTEHPGPKMKFVNGSRNELFGSFWYASFGKPETEPGIEIVDSQVVIACYRQHSFGKGRWNTWIKATLNGETKTWNNWNLDFLTIGVESEKGVATR